MAAKYSITSSAIGFGVQFSNSKMDFFVDEFNFLKARLRLKAKRLIKLSNHYLCVAAQIQRVL